MSTSPKTTYLVCYSYGMGGLWAYIDAYSPQEIERRYPELKVVNSRPSWMTDEIEDKLERCDIDAPSGWLKVHVENRTPGEAL